MNIEDDLRKLKRLDKLMAEYWDYINNRENQPLAAQTVALVGSWIKDNLRVVSD